MAADGTWYLTDSCGTGCKFADLLVFLRVGGKINTSHTSHTLRRLTDEEATVERLSGTRMFDDVAREPV